MKVRRLLSSGSDIQERQVRKQRSFEAYSSTLGVTKALVFRFDQNYAPKA
jgi:hypothetical protein